MLKLELGDDCLDVVAYRCQRRLRDAAALDDRLHVGDNSLDL